MAVARQDAELHKLWRHRGNACRRWTVALLRPKRLLGLDITKARHTDWTDEEQEKLLHYQTQGNLFSEVDQRRELKQLRKIPFDFYYR